MDMGLFLRLERHRELDLRECVALVFYNGQMLSERFEQNEFAINVDAVWR